MVNVSQKETVAVVFVRRPIMAMIVERIKEKIDGKWTKFIDPIHAIMSTLVLDNVEREFASVIQVTQVHDVIYHEFSPSLILAMKVDVDA